MAFRQLCVAGATLLATLFSSSGAFAQNLSLKDNQDGVRRDPQHDHELDNNEINRADCDRNEIIHFNVDVDGKVSNSLDFQVWRGTGCADADKRFESSSNCVQIPVQESRNERSLDVDIPVQLIMGATNGNSGGGGSSGSGGTAGTAGTAGTDSTAGTSGGGSGGDAGNGGSGAEGGTGGAGGTAGTAGTDGTAGSAATGATGGTTSDGGTTGAEACEGDPAFPEPTQFTLHFILVDGNGDQPASNYKPATWNASYDLIGPDAPRDLSVGVGESTLVLGWTIEDNRGDIKRYNAYCDPPPNTTTEGAGGEGAGGEGNEEPEQGCPQALYDVVENELSPDAYFCGESDGYSASMQTAPLENGVKYTVAVAAVDNFNNRGPLTDPQCKTPQLVTDFYEAYRQAGGKGGGGFCAIGAGRSTGFVAILAFGAVALFARRRARSRKDSARC